MKFSKISIILVTLIVLSGCVQSTALLGSGITVVTSGNILQAGFQYGANTAIKNETGKDPFNHMLDAVDNIENDSEKKRSLKDLKEWAENKALLVRKKLTN
ncbi:hypothetical protein [Candidatus Pelagibacter bacterium nBUS_25]|uniref:hypothetical protein n=1 Tax=Candidatus Pelagibacter bacterium nBUS_25 TaxID=3374187 RepID=UPI003EB81064